MRWAPRLFVFGLVAALSGRLPAQEPPSTSIQERFAAERARDGGFSLWVFGFGGPETARQNLYKMIAERVEAIDFVCGLRVDQKQQLERVCKGDVHRLYQEIEQLAAEVQEIKSDRQLVRALQQKHSLLPERVRTGPRGPHTLLAKSIGQILTEDQLARYAPLGEVVESGGLARITSIYGEPGLALDLAGAVIGDAELARIATLPRIRLLDLRWTKVTDAGIKALPASDDLWSLDLTATAVTDAGLVGLRGFPNLRTLQLRQTAVTDGALEGAGTLALLIWLSLDGTRITDAGLAHLRTLTQLRGLQLGGTRVTDEGLRHLDALTMLDHLDLRRIPITNAGLRHLRPLTRLAHLNLEGTRVSDSGLPELFDFKELGILVLQQTDVTPQGIAAVKAALPTSTILADR